jgi:hypothetical protein
VKATADAKVWATSESSMLYIYIIHCQNRWKSHLQLLVYILWFPLISYMNVFWWKSNERIEEGIEECIMEESKGALWNQRTYGMCTVLKIVPREAISI